MGVYRNDKLRLLLCQLSDTYIAVRQSSRALITR